MIEIIKDMPFPIIKRKLIPGGDNRKKYPFDTMVVGDCFSVGVTYTEAERVRAAARAYGNKPGRNMKFTVRKTDDGWFIWRVE
jgi:hypothetical protein